MLGNYQSTTSPMLWRYSNGDEYSTGDDCIVKIEPDTELTFTDNRNFRPPSVPPSTASESVSSQAAILPTRYNNKPSRSQDVRSLVNSSAPSSSTVTRTHGFPNSSGISVPNSPHVLNNTSSLRTPIFDLTAQYGLPSLFPPPPRLTPKLPQAPAVSNLPDFQTLKSNYLSMLSQPSPDNTMAVDSTTPISPAGLLSSIEEDNVQGFLDVLASPEFKHLDSFDAPYDYLTGTSPLLESPWDTPYDDFATSPLDDSPFQDFLTTPVIQDLDPASIESYDASLPLFGGNDMAMYESSAPVAVKPKMPETEKLYTISPGTPSLDPTSLYPSPRMPTTTTLPATRRKSSATGTRKNITPESLVPIDAPTQPRKYVLPSATSRKEVPAVFAKKRSKSMAFGDEEDELDEPLAANATEKEQIEWKRRQNTLAARKSRKRKLEYQQQLEVEVQRLSVDVQKYKTQAETMRQILSSHGLALPPFDD
ncbi:hypothetical protein C8J56DRAFT_974856 [Mycena floridula]|nr:hypothetical protein C8J56DRAFT_974856 [Mycena floridula]